ncbi:MAG TPA: transaldolase [Burkholderiales bacterium]|jgi:transaldolase|nr:transaldolase [Burkholderiales bacterium]
MSRLKELERFGQSVWIDFIRRELLTGGGLEKLVREDGVKGLTSNPAIFEKAIGSGAEYRAVLASLSRLGETNPQRVYETIAIEDIRMAADQMSPVFQATGGRDGFVSLEVSPKLAHDTAGTIAEAHRLWSAVDRPNLMIKVPATAAGIPAIERLIADGLNINVTLLFAVPMYARVVEAYLAGLEQRAAAGKPVAGVASVASFFVSRIDTAIDAQLQARSDAARSDAERTRLLALRGKAAIANAKLAYAHYKAVMAGQRWRDLARRGAQSQRLLWASTSTKNPDYPDTLYVDELIGPDTVNTIPPATLDAFRDHGKPAPTLERDLEGARSTLAAIAQAGVSLDAVTAQLLDEGVKLFADAFDRLLDAVNRARQAA